MDESKSLSLFIENLRGEVLSGAAFSTDGEEGKFSEEAFTDYVCEILVEEAEEVTSDISLCTHQSRGVKLNAWHLNDQENELTLIVTHYSNINDGGKTDRLSKSEIDKRFKRAKKFFEESVRGTLKVDESMVSFQVGRVIRNCWKSLDTVKIILITDCITGAVPGSEEIEENIKFDYRIWDIEKLHRQLTSGIVSEPITLDFNEICENDITLVKAKDSIKGYGTYLGFLSGELLFNMYDKHGLRLLEKNVRAFLQARSNVNKGIRDTILHHPEKFLAYNNGLTIIADSVELESLDNNTFKLNTAKNFQIVNGGQTCASIWYTKEKNRIDISDIQLVMKLNVIEDADISKEMAPKISEYSNSQNAVNIADFSANDEYQIEIEKLSLNTYVPDPTGGSGATMWFYERARGSYQATKNLERTSARMRAYDRKYPKSQLMTKTTWARAQMACLCRPHDVSWGPMVNFKKFVVFIKEQKHIQNEIEVDLNYFKEGVAKEILFRNVLKVIQKQALVHGGDNKPHLTGYAIALYVHRVGINKINFMDIWENQSIDDNMKAVFDELVIKIRDLLKKEAGDGNRVTLMKKEDFWLKVKSHPFKFSTFVKNHFDGIKNQDISIKVEEEEEKEDTIKQDYLLNADLWKDLHDWGSSTKSLESINVLRANDFYMNILLGKGHKNKTKRMKDFAKLVIINAKENGFDFSSYDGID